MKIKLEGAPQTRQTVDEEWEMIQTDMAPQTRQTQNSALEHKNNAERKSGLTDCEQALMERSKAKMELDRNRTQENILENHVELMEEAYKRKEIRRHVAKNISSKG
ncbi:hypothetical protein QE152_g23742 [Popillia japonica]|uniref:Uncharacterized protein n=1 Tax=Popillia japonica TaxID=7064 RepID=A0AAW1KFX4_POPJA